MRRAQQGAGAALTDAERLRLILALRMLVIAWTADPHAKWTRLVAEAVGNGAQYEPAITPAEVEALWPYVGPLFDPARAARQAQARRRRSGPRNRPGRPGRPPTDT